MNFQIDADSYPSARISMMTLSDDSYIRLTLETFLAIPLVHLLSALDDDDKSITLSEGASLVRVSGYTEWLSTTTPTITLGWDWELDVSQRQPLYVRLGAPRSNIMLIDALHDLGPAKTSVLLKTAIDALAWQKEVIRHMTLQYT